MCVCVCAYCRWCGSIVNHRCWNPVAVEGRHTDCDEAICAGARFMLASIYLLLDYCMLHNECLCKLWITSVETSFAIR